MNAYEIADELDGRLDHKAANMLRQQADRIAELEHMNKNWQLSETMAYNRIAELEKQLEEANSVLDTIDCGDSIK